MLDQMVCGWKLFCVEENKDQLQHQWHTDNTRAYHMRHVMHPINQAATKGISPSFCLSKYAGVLYFNEE